MALLQQFGVRGEMLASCLVTSTGRKKGDRVLIFAETQLDWITCMLACFRQEATIVIAYATLGATITVNGDVVVAADKDLHRRIVQVPSLWALVLCCSTAMSPLPRTRTCT